MDEGQEDSVKSPGSWAIIKSWCAAQGVSAHYHSDQTPTAYRVTPVLSVRLFHSLFAQSLSESLCTALTAGNSPAVGAVQGDCQWPLINGGNFHRSHEPTIHCDSGKPNLSQNCEANYLFIGHFSDSTAGPIATRQGLWSSLPVREATATCRAARTLLA